jgi:hypothetical protein
MWRRVTPDCTRSTFIGRPAARAGSRPSGPPPPAALPLARPPSPRPPQCDGCCKRHRFRVSITPDAMNELSQRQQGLRSGTGEVDRPGTGERPRHRGTLALTAVGLPACRHDHPDPDPGDASRGEPQRHQNANDAAIATSERQRCAPGRGSAEGAAPVVDDAAAAARLADLVSPEAVDRMLADAQASGMSAEGLLAQRPADRDGAGAGAGLRSPRSARTAPGGRRAVDRFSG